MTAHTRFQPPSERLRPMVFHRILPLTLVLSAAMLAGCASKDAVTTSSIPDDYRTRHPIVLTEAEHTLDVPVASGDRSLTLPMRDNIRGFAQDYKSKSKGTVQIMLPQGSANAGAAAALRKQVRATLVNEGVPNKLIIETAYGAAGQGDAAPIRLAFVSTTAKTNTCGQWPEDLTLNTMENRQYYNFGCATQANLAAQIANPMDLVGPRGMTPIDAERRATAIQDYRENGTDD